MKQLLLAVLLGLAFCTHNVISQTSGFSQQGKVTHEMKDEGFSIAHSSLPLNSKAKIVNTSTGKEAEVTITRLIPASQSRIADVSPGVWQELGLSADTDVKIYTTVSARPQTPVAQTVTQQSTTPQTATAQTTAQPATRTAQTGTTSDSLGNLPAGIHFENNNNFIINGNPAAPSAVASETRTQTGGTQPQQVQPQLSYYDTRPQALPQPPISYTEAPRPRQTLPAGDMWAQILKPAAEARPQQTQPAAAFDIRPQQTQPVLNFDTRQQQAQPSVNYYEARPSQPALSFDTRQQQAPPAVNYYETRPQQTQPAANYYEARPQTGPQPAVNIVNWPQPPIMPQTGSAPSAAVTYTQPSPQGLGSPLDETRPGQGQPLVRIESWPQVYQTAQPVISYEAQEPQNPVIPEKNLPEIRTNMVNEILSPASRTFVYIDASPDTPVPSVTIDNGPQTFRSVRQE